MRYLTCISYDGTNFYGSSPQPNKRTITSEVENVLSKITNEKIKIYPCSRTDKGVHANNFYFHFDINKELNEKNLRSLNKLTEDDIYFKSIKLVDNSFHARFDVKDKEYIYIINTGEYNPVNRNSHLQYCKEINIELLEKASKYLIGTHNFKSFTSDNEKESYIRTINYIKFEKKEDLLIIKINADGFLKYMVRNIIGLFLDINEGKIKINDLDNIITSENRTMLGLKAPAYGLYLNKVNYDIIQMEE